MAFTRNTNGQWVFNGGTQGRPQTKHMGMSAKKGGTNAKGSNVVWGTKPKIDARYTDSQYFEQLAPLQSEYNRTKLEYLQALAKMRHDDKSAKYDLNTKYGIERDRAKMDFADRGLVTGGNSGNVDQVSQLMRSDYANSLSDISHTYGNFAQSNIQSMLNELERGLNAQQAALLGSAAHRYNFEHDKLAPGADSIQGEPVQSSTQPATGGYAEGGGINIVGNPGIDPSNVPSGLSAFGTAMQTLGNATNILNQGNNSGAPIVTETSGKPGWFKRGSTWFYRNSQGTTVKMDHGPPDSTIFDWGGENK